MLNSIGLIDIITTKHSSTCSLAETHQTGSILIDSICISSSLSILRTGYYPVDQALSDCCAIWLKLSISQTFGLNMFSSALLVSRRLQCNNPRVVANFQKDYLQFLKEQNLFERIYNVQTAVNIGDWNASLQ